MLTKGDLVRIPQNTHLTCLDSNSWRLHVTSKPQFGIVLEVRDHKCKVLLDNSEWEIKSKDLRLCGGENVCKAS